MSANDNSNERRRDASAPRPDILVGRKLPAHSLWEQLQRRQQPLALEFCSAFFNNEMSYVQARKWLADYGIKASKNAVQGFFNSQDMRLRYAALQAAESAETAKSELPADIEAATRERIAQHKFELSFMNLSAKQKLQLIEIQQDGEIMKGDLAIKKSKLELEREKFEFNAAKACLKELPALKAISANKGLTETQKVEQIRLKLFGKVPEVKAA